MIFNLIFALLFIILAAFAPANCLAASAASDVKRGNDYYKNENYDQAISMYESARIKESDPEIINFNLGTALYRKGQLKESIEAFTLALNTENISVEEQASYNIANAKYNLGSSLAESDPKAALEFYGEALDYYKRSIELNQKNTDAMYNYELVEQELKLLMEKLKSQPPQDDEQKDSDKKDQEKEQQESADQEKQRDNGEEEKKDPSEDSQQQEKADDKSAKRDEAGKEDTGSGEQAEEIDQMTPDEAKALLEAFGKEEDRNLEKNTSAIYPEVAKDW
ncbi:MAG: tetratricopeptide repeat protein [Nitrospira sp.]|nr:tetratricopeptide repeat protein [bacterium]MBL7048751.1 tetratricopeptide repeat protein [Nitrospira sp.]